MDADESYVAAGFVVHNCRSQIRAATQDDYDEAPLTKRGPSNVPAADGFGAAPRVDRPWQPDLNDYPMQLAGIYDAKRSDHERE